MSMFDVVIDPRDLDPNIPEDRAELAKRAKAAIKDIRKHFNHPELYSLELYIEMLGRIDKPSDIG